MLMGFWFGRSRVKQPPVDRGCDVAPFRPDDEIDELFGGGNPNPQRIGCPEHQTLRAAARKKLPLEHEVYEHLGNCSDCYREFRAIQQSDAGGFRVRAVLGAAAALVIAAVGAASVGRGLVVAPWDRAPQAIVLDYRNESVNRSDAGEVTRRAVVLPRKTVAATILMPTGSEPGAYEIRVVDQGGHVWLSQQATGIIENFVASLKTNLELRSVPDGAYFLETRGAGEDWDLHPIRVQ